MIALEILPTTHHSRQVTKQYTVLRTVKIIAGRKAPGTRAWLKKPFENTAPRLRALLTFSNLDKPSGLAGSILIISSHPHYQWQCNIERAAITRCRIDSNRSTMAVDNLENDRQTQAYPLGLGGEKWFKDF